MNKLEGMQPYVGLLAFSSMALTRVCDPILTTLSSEFQVSTGEAARVISWYAVAYGFLQLMWGPIGDRIGKLQVVRWTGFACAALCFASGFASDFAWLVMARIAMGAFAAAILPLTMAWIGDAVAYQERQETLARLMAASVIGMMAGQWLGGMAADHIGWRWAFFVLSAAFLLGSLLLGQRAVPAAQLHQSALDSRHPLIGHIANSVGLVSIPRVRSVLIVTAMEGALVFGPLAFAPSLLIKSYELSVTMAGALMMLYGLGGLAYALLAKRWLRVLGERGLAMLGGALIATSLLLLVWSKLPFVGGMACALGGLGFYMLHNTLQTQATQMTTNARGAAVALFASALFVGQAFGVGIVALFIDRSSLDLIYSGAALCIAILGWIVARKTCRAHA